VAVKKSGSRPRNEKRGGRVVLVTRAATKERAQALSGAKPSAAETIDRELAAAALEKRARHQKPSNQEIGALRRVERKREEQRRWECYGSIPKKHWREMSGRQAKVLNEQATRHGIPFGGRTVSLPDVVKRLHDFLAENKLRLQAEGDDATDPVRLAQRRATLAEAQAREIRAKLMVGTAVSTEEHDRALDLVCSAFRTAINNAAGELSPRLAGKSVAAVREQLKAWAEETSDRFFGAPEKNAE